MSHGGGKGEGSRKVPKSVTYYLNGPFCPIDTKWKKMKQKKVNTMNSKASEAKKVLCHEK